MAVRSRRLLIVVSESEGLRNQKAACQDFFLVCGGVGVGMLAAFGVGGGHAAEPEAVAAVVVAVQLQPARKVKRTVAAPALGRRRSGRQRRMPPPPGDSH